MDAAHLIVVACLALIFPSTIQGEPQIIEPFPLNIYPFENEKAQVSCVIKDTTGASPDGVIFIRRNQFGDETDIVDEGPSGRIYMDNRKEDGGKKVVGTLYFNRVILSDDSQNGGYECKGNSSGVVKDAYGFVVTVIEANEIPTAKIKGANVTLGESANLTCDVTNTLAIVNKFQDIMWVKNGQIIAKVRYSSIINPVMITKATAQDAGDYVCMGMVKFRRFLERNITLGTASLKIKLKIEDGVTNLTALLSSNVTMRCPADGYPLGVEWWRMNEEGQIVKLNIGQRYVATRPCPTCHFQLTIVNLESRDHGGYACVASSAIGSGRHLFALNITDEPITNRPSTNGSGEPITPSPPYNGSGPVTVLSVTTAVTSFTQSTLLVLGFLCLLLTGLISS